MQRNVALEALSKAFELNATASKLNDTWDFSECRWSEADESFWRRSPTGHRGVAPSCSRFLRCPRAARRMDLKGKLDPTIVMLPIKAMFSRIVESPSP